MANRQQRRASSAKYPTSLDAWSHDRIAHIELSPINGNPPRMIEFEVPDFEQFAVRGEFPNPLLREMALRIEGTITRPSELSEEEQSTYFELMCWTIVHNTRKPDLAAMAGGFDAAVEWVATQMPKQHRIEIWQRAVHIFGEADILAFLDALGEEVGGRDLKSVTDLARFRQQSGSDEVPAGVGAEGAAAE